MANPHLSGKTISQILTAACISGAILLAGCDSSVNQTTADASSKAARITRAAGDIKPTQTFLDSIDNVDDAARRAAVTAAITKIKSDANNASGAWKTYLEQKTVAEDLAEANKKLADALALGSTNSNLTSVVQSQLGAVASQQTQLQLMQCETKLVDLLGSAISFQIAADYVANLGVQAKAEESRAVAETPPDNSALQASIETAKAAVAKAQDVVSDYEKQIADKQARASQIYSETDAAIAAADTLKGNAAIDASKKAGEARKEADSLGAEVSNLQLTLSEAKLNLTFAKVEQTRLESQLASAQASAAQAATAAKAAGERAAFLHLEAKKILEGENGLVAKYKTFTELAASLEGEIAKAGTVAKTADSAFGSAVTELTTYTSSVSNMNLSSEDPLGKVIADPERGAILKLQQAAAKIGTARVSLVAYSSARLQADSATAMNNVYKAAGLTTTVTAIDAGKIKNLQDDAITQFRNGAQLAENISKTAKPTAPSKWLGLTVQSIALHGLYAATNSNKDQLDALAAAKAAKDLNPFLNLMGLTNP